MWSSSHKTLIPMNIDDYLKFWNQNICVQAKVYFTMIHTISYLQISLIFSYSITCIFTQHFTCYKTLWHKFIVHTYKSLLMRLFKVYSLNLLQTLDPRFFCPRCCNAWAWRSCSSWNMKYKSSLNSISKYCRLLLAVTNTRAFVNARKFEDSNHSCHFFYHINRSW